MKPISRRLYQEISGVRIAAFDCAWAQVELLPSAPYSVCDRRSAYTFGLAFERQKGVHAVGDDRRCDFDAWPGELACMAPDVEMFSESATGGEYLTLHAKPGEGTALPTLASAAPRAVSRGDRRALSLGWQLRRLLLAPARDALAIETHAALLLERGVARFAGENPLRCRDGSDRAAYGDVLDRIEAGLADRLSLAELADAAGLPLLRFLRGFTAAFGVTPHAYITERRLQRARRRLESGGESIAAIAVDCGFAHQSHFGAALRNRLGLSPRQYRALSAIRE